MPIQTPQWTEYLSCPVCENGFELKIRLPISLGCGHTICKTCLSNLQRSQCPFDLCPISIPLDKLPVNTALVLLIDGDAALDVYREEFDKSYSNADYKTADENENQSSNGDKDGVSADEEKAYYREAMGCLEKLSVFLRPSNNQQMSRPMQRKLVTLINCQPLEEEGRARAIRAARSLGERSVTELILQHQNPQQLSANLWAAVRTRGCQFLGPAMQEEVLKLVLLALEDGSALSRKVLVMFVVQKLEPSFPQASKTSIGHVVQLLYRASCFKVTKRDGDSSLMQLKEDFRTYETLRREHDAQIVQIATEAGLRIAPDQWSSLLYGDTTHKSHMQSIIDKLQTPQSFLQSVQELVIALQRTGDPGKLAALRPHLDLLSGLDPNPENTSASDWPLLQNSLHASEQVVAGLITFIGQHSSNRRGGGGNNNSLQNCLNSPYGGERSGSSLESSSIVGGSGSGYHNSRYKTSMCRDLTLHGSCPRGKNCSFAHSPTEMEQYRSRNNRSGASIENNANELKSGSICGDGTSSNSSTRGLSPRGLNHHNNHSQFNSSNIQLPTQQHPPSNTSGLMAGGSAHRMPSPAPSMRVPPLMSAVNPMTAPVAQVAPVPRGFDHNQNQPMSQIVPLVRYSTPNVPPPSTPSLQQQQNHSHHSQPQPNIMNPDAVVALAAAGPPPNIPPNHGTHPPQPAHLVGHHPQVGIAPQIQVHYPTIFQATLTMPQQGHRHIDQTEQQVPVPDPQQSHQQVYHYQQDIQVHPRTPESLRDEDIKSGFPLTIAQTAKVATKSLSALKSRKEEIIDSLQDIVGKEATKKISVRTEERANVSSISAMSSLKKVGTVTAVESVQQANQSVQPQHQKDDSLLSMDQDYSLWTSKAFTPFVNVENDANAEEEDSLKSEEQDPNEVSYSITHSISDELIPFSDSPQISRFGPISRKGITSMRNKPSQSQAIIDDQAHVSPVVSNSKQMSRPAPSLPTAFLQQTNGTFMALQPVALGVNGEIGYVAVQQPNPENNFVPGQEIAMDHQNFLNNMFNPPITSPSHHQPSAMVNQNYTISGNNHGGGSFSSNDAQPSQEALRQESERMKQELEVLQKKISCLNTQRMNNSSNGGRNFNFGADDRSTNQNNDVICSTAGSTVAQNETKQLATELQLIENTIKDREREMIQIRQPNMAGEGEANVEYGSYVAQGLITDGEEVNGRAQSITTTAMSGQMTRMNGNSFDPI